MYKSAEDLLIASVVGKHAFYVFNTTKLNLVFMSRFIAEEITYLQAAASGLIYTSLKESNTIVAWNKMHRHQEYKGHTNAIIKFIVSQNFIFSLAEGGELIIFDTQSGDTISKQDLSRDFDIMTHPVTYINKLVFAGGEDGRQVELWNVIEKEKIY